MKKQLAWILTLLLLISMTGCSAGEPNGTAAPSASNPPGFSGPSKPIRKEPPRLTVSFGKGDTFDAETCTYTWTYDTGDGTTSGICADSPHPLDLQELLLPVETTVDAVKLQFEVAPQRFSVRCWSDTHWGNMDSPAEAVAVSGNLLELKPGGYIYEVEADWTGENLAAQGTVHYVFYVIKHSVQYAHDHSLAETPQTVDHPTSGYCGNTVTTLRIHGQEYSFQGTDSVTLTDILINLEYDPVLLCKCLPDFYVETDFGMTYGVSFSGYARCEAGQANLTEEQMAAIQRILKDQT